MSAATAALPAADEPEQMERVTALFKLLDSRFGILAVLFRLPGHLVDRIAFPLNEILIFPVSYSVSLDRLHHVFFFLEVFWQLDQIRLRHSPLFTVGVAEITGFVIKRPQSREMKLRLSSGDLHLLKAPSIIKHQAMIKARSRQRHRLLVISGTAVQPYRYSSALHARGGRG